MLHVAVAVAAAAAACCSSLSLGLTLNASLFGPGPLAGFGFSAVRSLPPYFGGSFAHRTTHFGALAAVAELTSLIYQNKTHLHNCKGKRRKRNAKAR